MKKYGPFLVFLIAIPIGYFSSSYIDEYFFSKDATEQQGKEYTAAYICPMHCEGSGSEQAGTCPVCKMDYVANENVNSK